MKNLVFAFQLGSGEAENEALRLARTIRLYGGDLCFNPIWLLSRRSEEALAQSTRQELNSLGARLISFDMNGFEPNIPFSTYVRAAGIAEGLAQGEASFLAWMAADTLLLRYPSEFLLPALKSLGCCPVHMKLLGLRLDEPLDEFWSLVYQFCKVDNENIFPMRSVVDQQLIRAYVNAGLLVVRPERGLLRAWQANFEAACLLPEFTAFYQQSELYSIYMHQAILTGSVLSALKEDEILQFPYEFNYPLHLHDRVSEKQKPHCLSQLVTCRYDDFNEFFGSLNLDTKIEVDQPLKDWLHSQLIQA